MLLYCYFLAFFKNIIRKFIEKFKKIIAPVEITQILIIFITTYIIAFTPLREYIPGYASTKLKRDATELALKSDSLSNALKKNEAYIASIKKILTGDLDYAKFSKERPAGTVARA